MSYKTYQVRFEGVTPLLMHADSVEWSDEMEKWKLNAGNKKKGKSGDDRTPAWRWTGYTYIDGGFLCIPADNIMSALRKGGAMVKTGQGQKTFKAQTQSGIIVNEISWPLEVNGDFITAEQIEEFRGLENFDDHVELAKNIGFELFVKRAKIQQAKHIRVRPKFDKWAAAGTVMILDEMITKEILKTIFDCVGMYVGIGDWRPSSPSSPGRFGKFNVTIK